MRTLFPCTAVVPAKERFYVTFLTFAVVLGISFWTLSLLVPLQEQSLALRRHKQASSFSYRLRFGKPFRRPNPNATIPGGWKSTLQSHSLDQQLMAAVSRGDKRTDTLTSSVGEPQLNSCDVLFGTAGLVEIVADRSSIESNGASSDKNCLTHTRLNWVACPLSLMYWEKPHSAGHSNHTTIYGSLPPAQLSMPQTPGVKRFTESIVAPSKGKGLFARPLHIDDDESSIWHVLVFRETEPHRPDSSLLNSLKAHYQTYIILRHFQVPLKNVRIWFMNDDQRSPVSSISHDDAPWVQLWGIHRVGYWSDLVQQSTYMSRSVIVSATPTALGDEAVPFMKDNCKTDQSLLREWRDALFHAYRLSTRHVATPLSNTSEINVVTLLYDNLDGRPHWTSQDTYRAKKILRQVYNTPLANVEARSLQDVTFREQVMLLHQTDLLIYPEREDSVVSLFLPPGAKYVSYQDGSSRRMEYILYALRIDYEKGFMPLALRTTGFYAETNNGTN